MKTQKVTRFVACLLSLLLFVGSMPHQAFAADDDSQTFEVDAKFLNGETVSMEGTIDGKAIVFYSDGILTVTLNMQSVEYTMKGATNDMYVIGLEISDGDGKYTAAKITDETEEGYPLQYTFTLPEVAETTPILIGYSVPDYESENEDGETVYGWEHTGMKRQLNLDLSGTGLLDKSFEVDAKFMNGSTESMAGTISGPASVFYSDGILTVLLNMTPIDYERSGETYEMYTVGLEISDGNGGYTAAKITSETDDGYPLQYTFTLPEIAETTPILIGYSVPTYNDNEGLEHLNMSRQLHLNLSETGLVSSSSNSENTDEDAEDEADNSSFELAAGTYEVGVKLQNAADTALSMADGAISSTAQLVVDENEEATLYVEFVPMTVSGITAHMTNMYLYDGATPSEAKNNVGSSELTEVTYDNWYTEDSTNFPGTAKITLPYIGTSSNLNYLYANVAVDVMTDMNLGNQDVILVVDYSDITLQPTLALSSSTVKLIAADNNYASETVTAKVANSDAYQIAWSSKDEKVATVKDGVITAVGAGETTIVATATASGLETLQKEIAVTVHAAGNTAISATTSSSNGASTTVVSGDVLVSSASSIEADGANVTIDAVSSATTAVTDASVTLEESAMAGLANSEVSIATSIATVTYSKDAMAQILDAGAVTLHVAEAEVPVSLGSFAAAYSFNLTDKSQKNIVFDKGVATITIAGNTDTKYAYYYADTLKEKIKLAVGSDCVSFTTTHFSDWAITEKDYNIASNDSGTSGSGGTSDSFLLDVSGNYYVDIALWKATTDEASMGDVAFKYNRQALVTVKNGTITTVQLATNPVTVGTYTSAITSFSVEGTQATVQETTSITTVPTGSTYDYLKRMSFTLPSAAVPSQSNEVTYVDVEFVVPDTPMDEAVGDTLPARLRFDWSSASATSASSLVGSSKTATGTSSITGKDIEDVKLTDAATGIIMETTTDYVSSSAKMNVVSITSGDDYETATTSLVDIADSFELYKITLTVNGTETQPDGAVKLLFPSAGKELTIYRINDDGSITKLSGTISGQYYVISTSSLGLFAITEGALAEVIEEASFADIASHWAKDYIETVVARGLFNGTSETTFSPESSMTRGMFVTVLGRLAELDANASGENKFQDVSSDAYYAPYVAWASENGIVNGTSETTFTPEKAITRQEMAVMLYQYAVYADIELNTGDAKDFADAASIASWAGEAVAALSSAGVINGVSDTQFAPVKTATRAEVAALMAKFMEAYDL